MGAQSKQKENAKQDFTVHNNKLNIINQREFLPVINDALDEL